MLVPITQSILNGVAQSEVRVLVVGGAASLKIPEQGETTVLYASLDYEDIIREAGGMDYLEMHAYAEEFGLGTRDYELVEL